MIPLLTSYPIKNVPFVRMFIIIAILNNFDFYKKSLFYND